MSTHNHLFYKYISIFIRGWGENIFEVLKRMLWLILIKMIYNKNIKYKYGYGYL